MAIEAWVSRRGDDADEAKPGDITFLKLPGSPIGGKEREQFTIIIDWVDDEKEAQLLALKTDENPWPAITHPYLVTEEKESITDDDRVENEPNPPDKTTWDVWVYRSAVYVAGLTDEKRILLENADVQWRLPPASVSRQQIDLSRLKTLLTHFSFDAEPAILRLMRR